MCYKQAKPSCTTIWRTLLFPPMPSVPVAQKQERQNRLAQIDDKFLTTPNGPLSNSSKYWSAMFAIDPHLEQENWCSNHLRSARFFGNSPLHTYFPRMSKWCMKMGMCLLFSGTCCPKKHTQSLGPTLWNQTLGLPYYFFPVVFSMRWFVFKRVA